MVMLPGGDFMTGSPQTEPGRFDDEDLKRVNIPHLAVGKFPVTRAQWAFFVTATKRITPPNAPCAYAPTPHPSWRDPGFPQGRDHPVVCISWPDAVDYTRWLSKRTHHSYRLLTDPEWEYAARAGTTTAFPWGAIASHEFANYGEDNCCAPAIGGRDKWLFTSPVGSFPSNGFGLYDMHGNVFEWTATCADSTEKLKMPPNARGCSYRYARGGAYGERPQMMRSAAKNYAPPEGDSMTIETYRSAGFGLRVARDAD
jgi:formylglycine-generating enzyme required for sulfatase activity